MDEILPWLAMAGALVAALVLAGVLGLTLGRKARRHYPALAGALWMLSTFLKIDPPPPPKAERITRSEEDAGAPPKV